MRELGLAHLTLLQLDPPELVTTAAEAGFDFVGIRVRGATPAEQLPDMSPGSPTSRHTLARLAETGVQVADIEFLSLDGSTDRETWLPMLEAGAVLGATTLNLAGQDPDSSRLTETLHRLVEDAAQFSMTPALEPISYNAVSTVQQAADIASAVGAHIMLDPLHLVRGGSSAEDVAALDPAMIPVLQFCDGPAVLPDDLAVTAPLPRGMTAEGGALKVESRARRLPPGEGDFPLEQLLRAVPADVPISIEVPNAELVECLGPLEFARRLHSATMSLLRRVEEAGA
jgi:sugar phosphate isomerase/epimerase